MRERFNQMPEGLFPDCPSLCAWHWLNLLSFLFILPGHIGLGSGAKPVYPKSISLTAIEGLPEYQGPATLLLKEAYEKLGIDIEVQALPALRALKLIHTGEKDGDLGRLKLPEKDAENLVMIPTPIGFVQLAVYARKDLENHYQDWAAIRQAKLKIGKKRGGGSVAYELGNFTVVEANDYESLVMMLYHQRIDLVIAPNIVVQNTLRNLKQRLEKPDEIKEIHILQSMPIYHYLNEKHRQLVKPLNEILQKMQDDGSIAKFWKY